MNKQTIKTYDTMALEYDEETASFWERFPREVIDRFTDLMPDKKVLDLGSGPGRDGLILTEAGHDVTCLDASAAMVEFCSKRGLKSVLGDFNKIPFTSNSFDAVWAYTSLLHSPKSKINIAFAEIIRVLKENGVLGLGMIEGTTEGYRRSAGTTKPRWFSYYTEKELRELLTKHGFEVLHFSTFQPGSKIYLNFIGRKLNFSSTTPTI